MLVKGLKYNLSEAGEGGGGLPEKFDALGSPL